MLALEGGWASGQGSREGWGQVAAGVTAQGSGAGCTLAREAAAEWGWVAVVIAQGSGVVEVTVQGLGVDCTLAREAAAEWDWVGGLAAG